VILYNLEDKRKEENTIIQTSKLNNDLINKTF